MNLISTHHLIRSLMMPNMLSCTARELRKSVLNTLMTVATSCNEHPFEHHPQHGAPLQGNRIQRCTGRIIQTPESTTMPDCHGTRLRLEARHVFIGTPNLPGSE